MIRSEFRLPRDLQDRVKADAAAQGLDYSEYVRHALLITLTWRAASRTIKAGLDIDDALDLETFLRRLEEMARRMAEGD